MRLSEGNPLKICAILKHATKNSGEQTVMRTKWFKHIAIEIVQAHLLNSVSFWPWPSSGEKAQWVRLRLLVMDGFWRRPRVPKSGISLGNAALWDFWRRGPKSQYQRFPQEMKHFETSGREAWKQRFSLGSVALCQIVGGLLGNPKSSDFRTQSRVARATQMEMFKARNGAAATLNMQSGNITVAIRPQICKIWGIATGPKFGNALHCRKSFGNWWCSVMQHMLHDRMKCFENWICNRLCPDSAPPVS